MARKDSEHQKTSMSALFRGKAIFKPLNTGRIDEHVACIREWIANIFFYTQNGVTIMIDAGYNYERLKEKMGWLDIEPASIRHILITHQDTDHVGALETDSEQLFRDATVYIGEIENRYLTGETRRKVFHGFYKLPPHLDIPRLKAIHAATPVALVLHGSSGIPHDQVREAIAGGIVKVNLATEIKDNFMRALKKVLSESDEIDLRKVFPKAMEPVVELLKEKYAVTGATCEA